MVASDVLNPRLIAISGPAKGQSLPLRGECFTVGRDAGNDLQLASLEVSRRHCELCRDADGHTTVVDLDSRHGVFVNGRPVRRRRLMHSDLLTIGGSELLFLLDDTAPAAPAARSIPFAAGSTVAKKPTEVLYLDRGRLDAALPARSSVARDLHALLAASRALQGPLAAGELGERLLAAVRAMVPAERAAVLLREPGVEELTRAAVYPDGGAAFAPGGAVLDRVLGDKVGLLCDRREQVVGGASVAGVGSLLCAPLVGHDGDVLGVVYADHQAPAAFDERHLELLAAVAGIASLAFQNALHLRWLEGENRRLRGHQLEHEMVGESAPMRKLFDLVAKVARADTTVLIRGESGTGKELAAQAVHRSSPRAEGPFVAINCATLSDTLLESELFGHEKGAFTGAVGRKIGQFEAARGGTLFLDEVGEIPPTLQAKLLRVLQEREFRRLGGSRPIRADVRVVAATNRDLESAIRDGGFREDLYYRLKVITVETPPLRHRRDDIPLLARHFVRLHGRRLGRRGVAVSPAARRCLMAYPWPGNVRELGNVIERALVLGEGDVIGPEDLPDEVVEGAASAGEAATGGFQAAIVETKKTLVLRAWRRSGGDYAAAAEILGVHVNSLHRMISRLGLKDRLGS